MKFVVARQDHVCAVCKETIYEGDASVQSENGWGHMYHPKCQEERFAENGQWCIGCKPRMTKTAEKVLNKINLDRR